MNLVKFCLLVGLFLFTQCSFQCPELEQTDFDLMPYTEGQVLKWQGSSNQSMTWTVGRFISSSEYNRDDAVCDHTVDFTITSTNVDLSPSYKYENKNGRLVSSIWINDIEIPLIDVTRQPLIIESLLLNDSTFINSSLDTVSSLDSVRFYPFQGIFSFRDQNGVQWDLVSDE